MPKILLYLSYKISHTIYLDGTNGIHRDGCLLGRANHFSGRLLGRDDCADYYGSPLGLGESAPTTPAARPR